MIGGCASMQNPTKDWTAKRFYDEAQKAMSDKEYDVAIKHFEGLETRYPYGRYAQQAQLEIAYAYYKNNEATLAVEAADRFIRLHPTHPNIAYAYYLKGLVNEPKERGLSSYLSLGGDDSGRDAKSAQEAYRAFREVVERFPESRYAQDAARRMSYFHNKLAQHEIEVAQFYFDRDAYVAAVNRSKHVLENFQNTPSVEDALGIQAKAYQRMGLTKLMQDTMRVLQTNFPDSHHLDDLNSVGEKARKRKTKKKKKKKRKNEGAIVSY